MSEPKAIARTIDEVVPGLFHYQVHDERIDHISDGYAVVDKGRVILIDPLPIDGATLARLGAIGDIVVASASHQRSAWSYRRQTNASVHAPQGAQGLDEPPDATFRGGDRLPGGLRAMHAPGPKGPHYVLHLDRGPGVVLCTDLLLHDPGKEIAFLRDKYLQDPKQARESARALLGLKFEVICFGHGAPILKGGRKAVEDLLQRDANQGAK
ncbi:MAG TPA: MBL fold metallo-hydrolase [Candidatus Polarisedimenticolia bacterium]|nr:MBL fold metallo-hydrolase [Candidatus Polarisedimenticolia bacterium]